MAGGRKRVLVKTLKIIYNRDMISQKGNFPTRKTNERGRRKHVGKTVPPQRE
ncbi:MAG: hypothetical protein ACLVG7_08740 [Negativibacillus sp.]